MHAAKQLQIGSVDMLPSFADVKQASTKTSMQHISQLALAACFWILSIRYDDDCLFGDQATA